MFFGTCDDSVVFIESDYSTINSKIVKGEKVNYLTLTYGTVVDQ